MEACETPLPVPEHPQCAPKSAPRYDVDGKPQLVSFSSNAIAMPVSAMTASGTTSMASLTALAPMTLTTLAPSSTAPKREVFPSPPGSARIGSQDGPSGGKAMPRPRMASLNAIASLPNPADVDRTAQSPGYPDEDHVAAGTRDGGAPRQATGAGDSGPPVHALSQHPPSR